MLRLVLISFVLGALLPACEEVTPPPPPPNLGHGVPPGVGTIGRRDAGIRDMAVDGDSSTPLDGGVSACLNFDEGAVGNNISVTRSGEAVPFELNSGIAFYEPTPCADSDRDIVVLLSSSRTCGLGASPYFAMRIDVNAIGGVLVAGSPLPLTFDGILEVFYVPDSLVGSAFYANCLGSTGNLTFEALSATPGRQAGFLDATLFDCDGRVGAVSVFAQFDLRLESRFEDVCTER